MRWIKVALNSQITCEPFARAEIHEKPYHASYLLAGFQIDRHDDDSLFRFCPLEVDPLASTPICLSLMRNHRVV